MLSDKNFIFYKLRLRLFFIVIMINFTANAMLKDTRVSHLDPKAEYYINKGLAHKAPYQVEVLGNSFTIPTNKVYKPGKLEEMVAKYLVEEELLAGKTFAEITGSCFTEGMIATKYGAKEIIGLLISDEAYNCVNSNIKLKNISTDFIKLVKGDDLKALLPSYEHKIDVLVGRIPWQSLALSEFEKIPTERIGLTKAFYDIDDKIINSIFSVGPQLLAPGGKLIITSSTKTLPRIQKLAAEYKFSYLILKTENLHNDGNMHYLLQLTKK